jgi:Ca2+-binding RTX toxin-like protein
MVLKMRRRRVVLLLTTMFAALIMSSGVAFAVNKVCPSGTTFASPCKGTAKTSKAAGDDALIGTSGADYIFALSGNDKIAAGALDDYTDGGVGNDTYSYKDGWGTDTLVDTTGVDTLNFSAVSGGISASLYPEYSSNPANYVNGPAGESVKVSTSTLSVIEKVVGSASGSDSIDTGGAANTLQPGPGTGGITDEPYY